MIFNTTLQWSIFPKKSLYKSSVPRKLLMSESSSVPLIFGIYDATYSKDQKNRQYENLDNVAIDQNLDILP